MARIDGQTRGQRGEALGDGPMPHGGKDQNSQHDAHEQDASNGEGTPRSMTTARSHFSSRLRHDSILADRSGQWRRRPLGTLYSKSETTMLYANVTLTPSTTGASGRAALQQIANGIASWALIGALVALCSARRCGPWAVTPRTCTNPHKVVVLVLTSLAPPYFIGAAPSLINFFFNTGLSVH